jgi:condensation domain-containing protein
MIVRRACGDVAPLSWAQQQIWLHAGMATEPALYNEPFTIHRTGPLDVGALEATLSEIVRRHAAWRTVFVTDARGEPMQAVRPTGPVTLPVVDLRALAPHERDAEARRLATADARRPFDLARGPLVRFVLVRTGDEEHQLFVTVHHIVLDGASIYRVLLPELTALYAALTTGAPSPLLELPVQYGDFAAWQRAMLTPEALAPHLAFWKQRLGDATALDLPTDRPRPAVQTFRGARHAFALPATLSREVHTLGAAERVTAFMVLLATFLAVLHRYTQQDDLVIGTVTAGRSQPEIEPLLGFFANPVTLRTDVSGDPPFRELLRRVRDTTLDVLEHVQTPFEHVVRAVGVERDSARHPLFDVVFSLEAQQVGRHPGWDVRHLDVDTGTTKFDLYLELDDRPDGITGRVVYRTDLFDADTIARLADHYRTLLEGAVADPGTRLSSLPLLTAPERAHILGPWKGTRAPYPGDRTV